MSYLYKIKFMANKFSDEFRQCKRKFTHETHAIKITDQHKDWLTVYARNRKTREIEFQASFRKYRKGQPSRGFSYMVRNSGSLSALGVPK